MKILEILLPKGTTDKSLPPGAARKIGLLQQRMDSYVDKIMRPETSAAGREFLKARLRDDYHELRGTIPGIHHVAEAINKLPLSNKDFELVKELMNRPIPAAIAPIYIQEVIDDDEFNDQLLSLEESNPSMDVRPLIAEWLNRVMPDQMCRFNGDVPELSQQKGILSPVHGYDPKMYKSEPNVVTGNATGRF